MGHKSVPIQCIVYIQFQIRLDPDFLKVVELVTGFQYVPMTQNFGPAQPEENWRANFEMEEVYRCSFRSGIRLRFGNDG